MNTEDIKDTDEINYVEQTDDTLEFDNISGGEDLENIKGMKDIDDDDWIDQYSNIDKQQDVISKKNKKKPSNKEPMYNKKIPKSKQKAQGKNNNKSEGDSNSTQGSDTQQQKQQLMKQLQLLTVSYKMVNIVIFTTILSSINVNKLRLQLIDQLNNTKCADSLPDTKNFPLITSILFVYATYAFVIIAQQGLQQQKETSVNPDSDPLVEAASSGYMASIFVFLASFIRLVNVINTSNNNSTEAQDIIAADIPTV